MMGQRHLKGLLRAGYHVTGMDPRAPNVEGTLQELAKEGIRAEQFSFDRELPSGGFDLAVFSETAPFRLNNFSQFMSRCEARRILLEKPLAVNRPDLDSYSEILHSKDLPRDSVSVNLSRRTWPFLQQLKERCSHSGEILLTVTGGALGLACNGIHYLDLFLFLSEGKGDVETKFVNLSRSQVASGRGAAFHDYGGTFILQRGTATFFGSLSAESSAPTVVSLRGDHFTCWIDESDFTFRLQSRKPTSKEPNYLYGRDYGLEETGTLRPTPLDEVTRRWANNEISLPAFSDSVKAHHLLFDILEKGGANPPYYFT
jgi:hypothetical protein